MIDLQDLTDRIRVWAITRELDVAEPRDQFLKLSEEVGELAEGLAKGRHSEVLDAIGDTFVVLTIMAMQLGTSIEDCVHQAYEEIKDRKGEIINGVFLKELDIKKQGE